MARRAALPLPLQCRLAKLPEPIAELRFAPPRRWRFDFAWPGRLLALEVDGGGWVNGRHSRGAGIEKDCEKINAAVALGYRLLRVTPAMIQSGAALEAIRAVFEHDAKVKAARRDGRALVAIEAALK